MKLIIIWINVFGSLYLLSCSSISTHKTDSHDKVNARDTFPGLQPIAKGKESINDTEDYFPMYYVSSDDAPESSAHSNKIIDCDDHSNAEHICSKANTSNLCQKYETYAYSFCRKSCKFCDPVDNAKHRYWRLVPGSFFRPTLPIAELKLYGKISKNTSELELDSVYASSSYEGYPPRLAFDNDTSTYWIPSTWGNHEPESEWIGVNLSRPDKVMGVKILFKEIVGEVLPTVIHLESSRHLNGNYTKRWTYFLLPEDNGSIILKPTCPPMWTKYHTEEYIFCARVFYEHKSWTKAKLECSSHNADLISIHSAATLQKLLEDMSLRGPAWIGLNDKVKEGKYEWSDSTAVDYLNWGKGCPNDQMRNEDEDCVFMNSDGTFETSFCDNHLFYICNKPYTKFYEQFNDPMEPEVVAPVTFESYDYYEPKINNPNMVEKVIQPVDFWPKLVQVPVTMDENTTYTNRFEKFPNMVNITLEDQFNRTNPTHVQHVQNKVESVINESPSHRFLEKRAHNMNRS